MPPRAQGYATIVRPDGRLLAVGRTGVVLWDLARGTELAFLPIGNAWHVMFEPSGDLITSGDAGVQRWPIRLDTGRGEFCIGPPNQLPLPPGSGGSARTDRAGSWPWPTMTLPSVATPERTIRSVPWTIAGRSQSARTGNGWRPAATESGAQVWRITDL